MGPPHRRRGRPVGERLTAAALLLLNLVLLGVFSYRLLLDDVWLSFTDWTLSAPGLHYIGLANYREWLRDPNAHQVLLETLFFTIATVGLSMLIGLALALRLDRRLRGRNLVRSAIFAPFVLSGTAVGLEFQFIFDPHFGLLEELARRVGFDVPYFYQDPAWALVVVTLTYVWKNIGYTFVIYLATLQDRRTDLDEAAEIDGASARRRFTKVLLASAAPHDVLPVDNGAAQLGTDLRHYPNHDARRPTGLWHLDPRLPGNVRQPTSRLRRATIATIMFVILLGVTIIQVRFMDKEQKA